MSKATADRIAAILALVNDDGDARQVRYAAHLAAAVEVAEGELPADPCVTKLYGWRTAGSSAPGGSFAAYATALMGIYTLQ